MINIRNTFLFLTISALMNGQVMWEMRKDTIITWHYQEGDEFNGEKVNTDYWKYNGWARSLYMNKEQQYYSDGENHVVSDGTLKLIAKKDSVYKRTVDWMNDSDSLKSGNKFYGPNKKKFSYTSGQLESKNKFNKGFFECRFKLPKEKGYWPAFWLYGGSPNEEIDFLEAKSERKNQVHIDTHCPNHCDFINQFFQKRSYGGWVKTTHNFSDDFHIIGGEWDKDQIRFYLNGECIGVSHVKFDIEKCLVLNLAIPSNDGPFKPGPDKENSDTAVFEIDYVRVWSKSDQAKKNGNQTNPLTYTDLQKDAGIITKSQSKTKSKIVYGKNADHKSDGIFISLFDNPAFIQITTLGIFKKEKPSYKIIDGAQKEIVKGTLDRTIFNIDKSSFTQGEYSLIIDFEGKSVEQKIQVK